MAVTRTPRSSRRLGLVRYISCSCFITSTQSYTVLKRTTIIVVSAPVLFASRSGTRTGDSQCTKISSAAPPPSSLPLSSAAANCHHPHPLAVYAPRPSTLSSLISHFVISAGKTFTSTASKVGTASQAVRHAQCVVCRGSMSHC